MADSTAHAHWQGSLLEGSGSVAAGSGVFGHLPVSWATRTERVEGTTSPEELIAAAHAACYAMAFSNTLAQAGSTAESLEVGAVCTFHPKSGGGFEIRSIALTVEGVVPGIDQAENSPGLLSKATRAVRSRTPCAETSRSRSPRPSTEFEFGLVDRSRSRNHRQPNGDGGGRGDQFEQTDRAGERRERG